MQILADTTGIIVGMYLTLTDGVLNPQPETRNPEPFTLNPEP